MLSLLSLSSRAFQPYAWTTRAARFLWSKGRTASSTSPHSDSISQDTKADQESALALLRKSDFNAYVRWRRRNDDDYRKGLQEHRKRYARSLMGREQNIARAREYAQQPETKVARQQVYTRKSQEDLGYRRSRSLLSILHKGRWIKEAWTWKLHTPVFTPDRVDRHCTACHKDRFLKLWWATKADPTTYMCNWCFANDFNLMVPEGQHKKLPQVFTSPNLPHPPTPRPRS